MNNDKKHKNGLEVNEAAGQNSGLCASFISNDLLCVFDVIYADPPWQYSFSASKSRSIESHYQTMTVDDIKALMPKAADNAVLFLWATAPKLLEAIAVLQAWGFEYKTHAIWDKEYQGMGYWFRSQHELLLVGVRGTVPPPKAEYRISSIIRIPRNKHSRKPDKIREYLEKFWPDARRIELFARESWPGWETFGNETEKTLFSYITHNDKLSDECHLSSSTSRIIISKP